MNIRCILFSTWFIGGLYPLSGDAIAPQGKSIVEIRDQIGALGRLIQLIWSFIYIDEEAAGSPRQQRYLMRKRNKTKNTTYQPKCGGCTPRVWFLLLETYHRRKIRLLNRNAMCLFGMKTIVFGAFVLGPSLVSPTLCNGMKKLSQTKWRYNVIGGGLVR